MKPTLVVCIVLLTFFGITKAASSAGPLDGVWINLDPVTRSIPKIEIAGTRIVWWGRTHPQGSKYGPMPLTFSGDSVEDKSPDKYGYVSEDVGFANHVMMLKRLSEAMSAPSAPKAESTAFDSEHPSVH
jgi:hypothetical protein